MGKKSKETTHRIVCQNRKARHNYSIEETFEAGIVLQGSEVKSLRAGKASLVDAYGIEKGGEIFLSGSYIPEYDKASHFNHESRRLRKLLLHKRQISKLIGAITAKGYTLVPLSIYFNEHNKAKVEIALCKGKKQYDKRETEKRRDANREAARALKGGE